MDNFEIEEIQKTVEKIRKSKVGADFKLLFDYGDTDKYVGEDGTEDKEKADVELCTLLARWLSGKAEAVDWAYRQSALCGASWEIKGYREKVIQKSLSECGGQYKRPVGRPKKSTPLGQKAEKDKTYFTIEDLEEYLDSVGIEVKHNVISNNLEIIDRNNAEREYNLQSFATRLFSDLRSSYKGVTLDIMHNYLHNISLDNRYNPALEYIDNIKYDGKDHFKDIYKILHIAENDTLSRMFIKKWFMQGYAMLKNGEDGLKNTYGAEGVLTLIGEQGAGKTTFFEKAAIKKEWFCGGQAIDNRDKDTYRRCVTFWITELGELETTMKSDVAALKAFITNSVDRYRLPYARADEQNARRTNFCATCNSDRFLADDTGSRRFWCIKLTEPLDLELLNKIDFRQVWAQARELCRENLQGFRLLREELQQLTERNAEHNKLLKGEQEIVDIIQEAEEDTERFEWQFTTITKFKEAYGSIKHYPAEIVSKALASQGYQTKRKKSEGRVQRLVCLPLPRYVNYS